MPEISISLMGPTKHNIQRLNPHLLVYLPLPQVFVEPIPQLYAKLQESVKRWPNATAVNLALSPNRTIAETKAEMWCYGAAFDSQRLGKTLPGWANQICSFNASHIEKHFKGVQVTPVTVTAVSLEELLRRSNIKRSQVSQSQSRDGALMMPARMRI
jgi:hypothetical protein